MTSLNARPQSYVRRLMFSGTVTDTPKKITPLDSASSGFRVLGQRPDGVDGVPSGGLIYFEIQNNGTEGDLYITQDPDGFRSVSGYLNNWIVVPPGGAWSAFTRDIDQQIDGYTPQFFYLRTSSGSILFTGSFEFWITSDL